MDRRVLFHDGLGPQQEALVGNRFHVVGLDANGLVDGLQAVEDELHLFLVREAEVARRLVPVVGGERVIRLGVLRLELDALAQVLDQLGEVALAVVVAADGQVDVRVVRLGVAALEIGFLGHLVLARVLVNLGQLEVVRGLVRRQLDHALDDRLGLRRIGQLVGAVRRDEELERQGAFGHRFFGELLTGELVVVDRLLQQRVVRRFALARRAIHVVVGVGEVEVDRGVVGIQLRRGLVAFGGRPPIAGRIELVAVLERLHGADLSDIAATGQRDAQPDDQRHERCRRPHFHHIPPDKV